MSAEEYLTWVLEYVHRGGIMGDVEATVCEALRIHAHELAEKIRNDEGPLGRGLVVGPFWGDDRDREHAANLIDPEVSNG